MQGILFIYRVTVFIFSIVIYRLFNLTEISSEIEELSSNNISNEILFA